MIKKQKVLFLIQDLGGGGAEKVLVNLVNNMDPEKFDITVLALFGGGENEKLLKSHIRYWNMWRRPYRGNSAILKLFSPKFLHKMIVRENFDIEVAYLEGASHRIISGCQNPHTRLFAWQHSFPQKKDGAYIGFKTLSESDKYYKKYNKVVCVSKSVKEQFSRWHPTLYNLTVAYNTNESEGIKRMSMEQVEKDVFNDGEIRLIGIGKITKNKGFDRLAHIHKRLTDEGYPIHTYILGTGADQSEINQFLKENNITNSFTFLGYQSNPYKYLSKCHIFVCSSYSEGFSTAATESLIVGTPIVTTSVSGMWEMLGHNNEYGVVTDNNEEALLEGILSLIKDPEKLVYYQKQARERGAVFNTENTVKAVEQLFLN